MKFLGFLSKLGSSSDSYRAEEVLEAYRNTMCAHERRDHRDRYTLELSPFVHIAWKHQREKGVLLPFGADLSDHTVPNSFMLRPDVGFTMLNQSVALDGWDPAAVQESGQQAVVPTNDVYGAMHAHVKARLEAFVAKLKRHRVEFHVTCGDAVELAKGVWSSLSFGRVASSNICDDMYAGLRDTLHALGPLLNKSNPHAALITLSMNWAPFNPADLPSLNAQASLLNMKRRSKAAAASPPRTPMEAATLATRTYHGHREMRMCDTFPEFTEWVRDRSGDAPAKVGLVSRDAHRVEAAWRQGWR